MASNNSDYIGDMQATLDARGPKKKQTSFDQTNTPAQYLPPATSPSAPAVTAPSVADGPVSRAAQQLPANPAQPAQSLGDARPTSIGDGRSAIYAGVGTNGEASFSSVPSSLNSLSTNFAAPNLPPDQRLSSLMPDLAQAGNSPARSSGPAFTSLGDISPGGRSIPVPAQPAQSLADGAQPRTTGPAYTSFDQIIPGNSSAPVQTSRQIGSLSDFAPGGLATAPSPAAQQQANLADAWRGGSSSGPGFAALGSSSNMGDGVGGFSQFNTGDAATAQATFQKAADLRDGYKAQDQLKEAVAAQTRDRNFNVVRDSSNPIVSRREQAFDLGRALTTQNLNNAVVGAQGLVDAQRQGVAANQQQRQANRLEDALNLATAPNATPEAREAYDRLTDPTGERALKRQQQQADIDASKARATKDNSIAESNGRKVRGLPAGLQKLEDDDIESIGSTKTINGSLDRIDSQIADGTLQLGPLANTVSSARNAVGSSDEVSTNYASFLATLEKLRNDSLRLNKGTQTEGDADRAWNELFTNIKDPKIVQQRIKEIRGYNNSAAALNVDKINNRRRNQGLDDIDVNKVFGNQSQVQQQTAQQQRQAPAQTEQQPVYTISTDDQYARLPSGAQYIDPQGNHRSKP